VHGVQAVHGNKRAWPTTYYHPTGPIGSIIAATHAEGRLHRMQDRKQRTFHAIMRTQDFSYSRCNVCAALRHHGSPSGVAESYTSR
jgi:hypothetical protein